MRAIHTSKKPTARAARNRTWLPLVAVLIVLAGAGCSSRSDDPDTAKAGDASTTHRDQAVRFSRCMRDNGVKDFPDPDASGRLTIDSIANNSRIDTDSSRFEQALTACRDLQPAGFTGDTRIGDQQAAALAFAQCVRDQGVTDFPDPGPGDPLIDTYRIPSSNLPGGMEKLDAATSTCGDLAEAALAETPTETP